MIFGYIGENRYSTCLYMEKDEAINEYEGTITSSPGPIPRLLMAICKAAYHWYRK